MLSDALLHLSPQLKRVLDVLERSPPGHIVRHSTIEAAMYPPGTRRYGWVKDSGVIKVTICHLRKRGHEANQPWRIESIRGIGYRLIREDQ